MSDYRERLLKRAEKVVPGPAYNQARREIVEHADIVPVFYEVLLREGEPWEEFRERVYPLFAKYLKQNGEDPERPRAVVVPIFAGDRCYLLDGRGFVDVLMEMEDLNPQALHFRMLRWLSS